MKRAVDTAPVAKKAKQEFRNYEDSKFQDRVEQTYFNIQTKQTVQRTRSVIEQYAKFDKAVMSVEEMMQFLDTIVDESDPDNDLPQSIHAYQTAESVLTRYFEDRDPTKLKTTVSIEQFFGIDEWEDLPAHAKALYAGKTLQTLYPHIEDWSWFPLVGLIHDLGKVCGEKAFGAQPQWSMVGDTFVLGCALDSANIYSNKGWYKEHNPDAKVAEYGSVDGIYEPRCGFGQCLLSFGHDEYLAMVLDQHEQDKKGVKPLPKEAVYMVRFHSFYPWHTPKAGARGYTHLASEEDWRCLPLLKALQKADLYSKSPDMPPIDELQQFYGQLIRAHFTPLVRW